MTPVIQGKWPAHEQNGYEVQREVMIVKHKYDLWQITWVIVLVLEFSCVVIRVLQH